MTAEGFDTALPPADLAAGFVHVWVTDVDRWMESPVGRAARGTADERRRAERFHNPIHGQRWSAGRSFLRATLAAHLRCDAAGLMLDAEAAGKPFLVGSPVSFNLSHSGDRLVVAVTSGRDVGVDVEAVVDLGSELMDLSERYFTLGEREEVKGRSGSERVGAFYRCWTRKEAVMKADGAGLAVPPETIGVGAGEDPGPVVADPPWRHLERYRVLDLALGGPYASALAVVEPIEVKITVV